MYTAYVCTNMLQYIYYVQFNMAIHVFLPGKPLKTVDHLTLNRPFLVKFQTYLMITFDYVVSTDIV